MKARNSGTDVPTYNQSGRTDVLVDQISPLSRDLNPRRQGRFRRDDHSCASILIGYVTPWPMAKELGEPDGTIR